MRGVTVRRTIHGVWYAGACLAIPVRPGAISPCCARRITRFEIIGKSVRGPSKRRATSVSLRSAQ